jgi:hypothetical protein
MIAAMILVFPLALYVAGTCALAWIATKVRGTKMAWAFALSVDGAAAYSTGFALKVLLMQLTGAIPSGQPWLARNGLVIVWTVLGITGFMIAANAKPNRWLAAVPCGIVGALMIMHGLLHTGPPESRVLLAVANANIYGGVIMICAAVVLPLVIPRRKLQGRGTERA